MLERGLGDTEISLLPPAAPTLPLSYILTAQHLSGPTPVLQNLTTLFMWRAGAWAWSEITLADKKVAGKQRCRYGQVLDSSTHKAWKRLFSEPLLPLPIWIQSKKPAGTAWDFMQKIILQNTELSYLCQQGRPLPGPPVPKHHRVADLWENCGLWEANALYFVPERHWIKNNKMIIILSQILRQNYLKAPEIESKNNNQKVNK